MPMIPGLSRREFGAMALAAMAPPGLRAAETAGGWIKLPAEPYKGKQDDIFFIDADHGWYGNGQGKLYRTADGGLSWTKIWDRPGTFIRALGFADAQTGYLGNVGTNYYPGVTDSNPLYKTSDGGESWTVVSAPGIDKVAGICGIDILPIRRVYQGETRTSHIVTAAGRVGGPAMMLRSEDDGESWRVIDLSAHAGMILDVKFHDARTGFVCASGVSDSGEGDAMILMTRDGGASWTPVWRSKRKLENCWKMSWPSRRIGYATVQSYDEANPDRVLIKTGDGGRSWHQLPLTREKGAQEFGVGFADERRGWIGTRIGGFETLDGGRNWRPVQMGKAVNKIRIVGGPSGRRAFAIGSEVHRLDL